MLTAMLAMAQADKVQIVLNGYEWSPERADQFEPSIPYFVYALQLMARKDDPRVTGWASLDAAPPSGLSLPGSGSPRQAC
jgi:polar amino acid transport system substrate-binding protein